MTPVPVVEVHLPTNSVPFAPMVTERPEAQREACMMSVCI